MDRRSFIRDASLSVLTLQLAGCGGGTDNSTDTAPTLGAPPASALPVVTFLTSDPNAFDYRPAVDSTGFNVVFERLPYPNPDDQNNLLYLLRIDGTGSNQLVPLLPSPPPVPRPTYPHAQTRPDWNWATGRIAFNGAANNNGQISIHTYRLPPALEPLTLIAGTAKHAYPIWTSDGTQLVTYNNEPAEPAPRPVTTLIGYPEGNVIVLNLSGNDAKGAPLFAGFAAPNPTDPMRIAFAGQPAVPNWASDAPAPGATPAYDQDFNYIYLNSPVAGSYVSTPLEPGASTTRFDPRYQGRAPYWSPDGNLIVFESNRDGSGYALYLADLRKQSDPIRLTDPGYWAQHAKFLQSGRQLVFTSLLSSSSRDNGPRGIAMIDISGLV